MTDEPVPVAVVGAGNMGTNHIKVYDELPESDLVEVVEPDSDRAAEVAREYDVCIVDSIDAITEARATSVAVPNELHRKATEECVRSGLDVLVEKPLAVTVEDAESIVETAEEHGAILQVGHIERFNPAIEVLRDILADEDLIALEAHRLGPFNEQLSTESAVFDLMIHDLDIIDYLVDKHLTEVSAVGIRSRSEELDHAVGHLQYGGDVLGSCVASHVTNDKIRELTVTTREMYIELDYQSQTLSIHRRGLGQMTRIQGQSGYRTEKVSETPFIPTREPLKNELEHFIDCVKTRTQPSVGGQEGIKATRMATSVIECIGDSNDRG